MKLYYEINAFRYKDIFLLFFSFVYLLAPAQFEKNYTPLHQHSIIPAGFLTDPFEDTKKQIDQNKVLTFTEAETYYSNMNSLKQHLFRSGKIYLQNKLTLYIDSLTSRLLLTEPKLKMEVKVYLTRFTEANAFCLADGSVFVNIGLVSEMNNETELAFILAHEIAHYANQHSIKDLKKINTITSAETQYPNKGSKAYRTLRLSRESEFDADSWGLQLIAQAGYDPKLAASALEKFSSNKEVKPLDLYKMFNNETFTIDTSWQTKKVIDYARLNYNPEQEHSVIVNKLGDLLITHPDVEKRIEALRIIAKETKQNKNSSKDSIDFAIIKQMAQFERIENNYLEHDYINATLNSIRMHEKLPENIYLQVSISRALYWLSYHKELGVNTLSITSDIGQNSTEAYKLYALINEMDVKGSKKLAYAYTRTLLNKYPDDENVLFYLALTTENYLGKSAARNYFKDYYIKFPNGNFAQYTKNKLQ